MLPTNELKKIKQELVEFDKQRENTIFLARIILKASKSAIYSTHRADFKKAKKQLDEAESNYISLIEHSEDVKYKNNLYNLYIAKGFYQKALEIINSIQLKNLSLIQVNQDRAYILYLLKKYQDSINQCYEILKIDDKNANTLNTLGLCFLHLQKYEEADKVLLKALNLDDKNIKILNSLGRLNHELRNSKKAGIYFDKAITLYPNSFETLNNMAGF